MLMVVVFSTFFTRFFDFCLGEEGKQMFLKCLNKRKEIDSSSPRNEARGGAELELNTLVLGCLEEGKQK